MANVILAAAVVASFTAALAGCKKSEPAAPAAPLLSPDVPQGFGPRLVWLAFRGVGPEGVARGLDLHEPASATWADGLKAAYQGRVFVTPPLGDAGWVLAASTRFPDPGDKKHPDAATPALIRLSQLFGEVQYFATYDVLDLHAWARFVKGAPVRKLAYLGADSVYVWADGEPTPEERKLGLAFADKPVGDKAPTEENVFAVAGAWSVDPSTLQTRKLPPSLGVVGSPPP
ncbi:MAG TPA: hypothetical protein VHL80_04890 [Polyangia bacterium]|nr:hypothetical protein [Polyangia bacterium]